MTKPRNRLCEGTRRNPGSFVFVVNITDMKRSVRIEESQKTVDIKDPKGELKFTVELFTAEEPTDSEPKTIYLVQVYNAEGEGIGNPGKFDSLRDAEKQFNRDVRNYSFIVKAESKPVDDIWVYADKIEYRKIDPDCCFNCEFCNREYDRCRTAHHHPYARYSLVCENPENFKFFEDLMYPEEYGKYTNEYFYHGFHPSMHDPNHNWWIHGENCHDSEKRRGCGCDGWELGAPPMENLGPHQYECPRHGFAGPHFYSLDVRPKVDFNGICKHYQRRKCKEEERH